MKNRGVLIVALSVLLLTQIPYWIAARATGSGAVFGGFLLNPIDGNSYLAKMYEGWSGAWQFHLPYTAEPGAGSYIFLFYIFLGHTARWLGLSLLTVFHVARGIATAALVGMLARFWKTILPGGAAQTIAFLLSAFGGGLGWLAYPILSRMTPDFWVAEAYPFLASYANPHFPLALAMVLFVFTEAVAGRIQQRWFVVVLASLALGIIMPFAVVITMLVLGVWALWNRLAGEPLDWLSPFIVGAGGAVPLIYELAVTYTNPALAAWNAQNVTPAPPLLDFAIGFLPAIFTACFAYSAVRREPTRAVRLLVSWTVLGFVLTYAPLALQRRFMAGWMIPIAGLAAIGLGEIHRHRPRLSRILSATVLICSLITPLLVLVSGLSAIQKQDGAIYLVPGESSALAWISGQTPAGSLILASPESGLLIPAYTGRRVVYGHPFETVRADEEKAWVESIYRGANQPDELIAQLRKRGVSYIYYGPREAAIGPLPTLPGMEKAYDAGGIQIYTLSG
jgi:hypothetical protein